MPLPFLTADRDFGGSDESASTALPFDDRDQWRRPYRPGPYRVGAAALLLLLASYVLSAAVIIALARDVPAAALCGGLAVVIIAVAVRALRMGTWVNSRGLRHVAFFSTQTVDWGRVTSARTVQQPVRWLGLPRTVQGQALVLVRRDRQDEQTTLLTTHNADFLGRFEAFDRAADSVEAWADEYRPRR
ncbi:hypothetical protein [Streptomyces beihaiensis]|uniref:PH domain-containing protein n=1 Tax=Streptomyces beihaiensis TaxID=2984495 RepID=A0ABT3U0D9_9ACTN|nr:hypothetical protein [Streptomyces beihaiensis]MCX3061750.1 hypothetical protein [Streptomyces beihaiensis]